MIVEAIHRVEPSRSPGSLLLIAAVAACTAMLATEAAAQSTNFEGQTGGIVAPFGAASVTVGGRL